MSWIVLAFLSAFTAALVAIFGKMGTEGIDTNLATAIRAIIMAIFTCGFITMREGWGGLNAFTSKAWLYITLSGIAGAASWLAYFGALKFGAASKVAPIDRLSVVFTLLLAWLVLGERMSWTVAAGGILMIAGSLLILKG